MTWRPLWPLSKSNHTGSIASPSVVLDVQPHYGDSLLRLLQWGYPSQPGRRALHPPSDPTRVLGPPPTTKSLCSQRHCGRDGGKSAELVPGWIPSHIPHPGGPTRHHPPVKTGEDSHFARGGEANSAGIHRFPRATHQSALGKPVHHPVLRKARKVLAFARGI